jgi:hypothetical protein
MEDRIVTLAGHVGPRNNLPPVEGNRGQEFRVHAAVLTETRFSWATAESADRLEKKGVPIISELGGLIFFVQGVLPSAEYRESWIGQQIRVVKRPMGLPAPAVEISPQPFAVTEERDPLLGPWGMQVRLDQPSSTLPRGASWMFDIYIGGKRALEELLLVKDLKDLSLLIENVKRIGKEGAGSSLARWKWVAELRAAFGPDESSLLAQPTEPKKRWVAGWGVEKTRLWSFETRAESGGPPLLVSAGSEVGVIIQGLWPEDEGLRSSAYQRLAALLTLHSPSGQEFHLSPLGRSAEGTHQELQLCTESTIERRGRKKQLVVSWILPQGIRTTTNFEVKLAGMGIGSFDVQPENPTASTEMEVDFPVWRPCERPIAPRLSACPIGYLSWGSDAPGNPLFTTQAPEINLGLSQDTPPANNFVLYTPPFITPLLTATNVASVRPSSTSHSVGLAPVWSPQGRVAPGQPQKVGIPREHAIAPRTYPPRALPFGWDSPGSLAPGQIQEVRTRREAPTALRSNPSAISNPGAQQPPRWVQGYLIELIDFGCTTDCRGRIRMGSPVEIILKGSWTTASDERARCRTALNEALTFDLILPNGPLFPRPRLEPECFFKSWGERDSRDYLVLNFTLPALPEGTRLKWGFPAMNWITVYDLAPVNNYPQGRGI